MKCYKLNGIIELFQDYSSELSDFSEEKAFLEIEVDVFDLPEIQCNAIEQVSEDIITMEDIYDIYKKLKVIIN